jgi:hypothetical protein
MGLTYSQKLRIIQYLATPGRWTNCYNIDFLTEEKRKWSNIHKEDGIIRVSYNEDKTQAYITHAPTGSSLFFDRNGEDITITDEAGRTVQLEKGSLKTGGETALKVQPFNSIKETGIKNPDVDSVLIEEMETYIRFEKDGSKSLFMDKVGKRIDFDASGIRPERDIKHHCRLMHSISFNSSATGLKEMSDQALLDATKLVLSRDLGLQPDLRAFNEIDPELLAAFIARAKQTQKQLDWINEEMALLDPEIYVKNLINSFDGGKSSDYKIKITAKDIEALQKKWTDSTDFTGHFIATPWQFFIEKTDDGYELLVSLDNRELICSHGKIIGNVMGAGDKPVQTVSTNSLAGDILGILEESSHPVRNHRGVSYNCILTEADEAALIAHEFRNNARELFGLPARKYVSVNVDSHIALLGIETRTLKKVSGAFRASTEMMELIQNDSGNDNRVDRAERVKKLLEQGASMKFIDPEKAQQGRTFANEMQERGKKDLLEAYAKKIGGTNLDKLAL